MKLPLKLKLWFYTRKQIMDEVQTLTEMLDIQLSKYIPQIEALEQNTTYVISDETLTPKEMITLRNALKRMEYKLKWTAPQIILINKSIRQMTKEELKTIAKSRITGAGNNIQIHNKT